MRVRELIEKLKDANPDAFVNIYFDRSSYKNILKSSECMSHRCITLTVKDVEKPFGGVSIYTFIKCEYNHYIPEASCNHDDCNEYWE